jgi:hypothetical protein
MDRTVYVRSYVFETELNMPFIEFWSSRCFPFCSVRFLFTDLLKSELGFFNVWTAYFLQALWLLGTLTHSLCLITWHFSQWSLRIYSEGSSAVCGRKGKDRKGKERKGNDLFCCTVMERSSSFGLRKAFFVSVYLLIKFRCLIWMNKSDFQNYGN